MPSEKSPPPEDPEIEEVPSESDESMGSDLDIDDMDEMHELGDDGMDLSNFLVTEDGETIANSLADIGEGIQQLVHQISTTNKILIKMMTKLS